MVTSAKDANNCQLQRMDHKLARWQGADSRCRRFPVGSGHAHRRDWKSGCCQPVDLLSQSSSQRRQPTRCCRARARLRSCQSAVLQRECRQLPAYPLRHPCGAPEAVLRRYRARRRRCRGFPPALAPQSPGWRRRGRHPHPPQHRLTASGQPAACQHHHDFHRCHPGCPLQLRGP